MSFGCSRQCDRMIIVRRGTYLRRHIERLGRVLWRTTGAEALKCQETEETGRRGWWCLGSMIGKDVRDQSYGGEGKSRAQEGRRGGMNLGEPDLAILTYSIWAKIWARSSTELAPVSNYFRNQPRRHFG